MANAADQLVVLAPGKSATRFGAQLLDAGYPKLTSDRIEILQVNLGKSLNSESLPSGWATSIDKLSRLENSWSVFAMAVSW